MKSVIVSQPACADTRNGRNVSIVRWFVEMWIVLYTIPNFFTYKGIYNSPVKSGEEYLLLH